MSDQSDMRVCMLSAEVRPYSMVGGLADVVADLPRALEKLGVEVRVFSPLYRQVRRSTELRKLLDLPPIASEDRTLRGALYCDSDEQVPRHFFIENDEFFDREGIYNEPATGEGFSDNFERYNFFMRASMEALKLLEWRPDVLHSHDCHTALVPAYLKLDRMGDPFYKNMATVLTIHNLAYQGVYAGEKFGLTGLPEELFYPMGPFEFFGQVNLLKSGICYADYLNTVSPQYAKEIQSEGHGCGLEKALQIRRNHLVGILNGIDQDLWNPETDPALFANYSASDLQGKRVNKERLQDLCGFPVRDVPLIGIISRLVEQKGFDLVLKARQELLRQDCQWVILGTGMKVYQDAFQDLSREHPERFAAFFTFDNELAHRIEGGADMFLMPSRFEPCGLNQMYSMRYGTVPIVRHTGGLADTVTDFSPATGEGTGFKFTDYHPRELLSTLNRAFGIWENPKTWRRIVRNAMAQDFSWDRSARNYVELYRKAIGRE